MQSAKDKAEKYGIENSVIFAGQRNDAAEIYQAMDVLLFPSCYEGKPLVPMEAQIAGMPVVVSDCITREIIKDKRLVRFIPLKASPTEWGNAVIDSYRNAPPRSETVLNSLNAERPSNELPPEKLTDWYCGLKR
ncbi:putative glycosyltransferase EpsF [bioreactor metagenome]|uniref:Putative glycosyltransferase EpsF n=1 Tax=bioreactor metagenome TaxID=1076179 RepID=A0A645FVJ6_9ZZZZ